jgi:myo-inositol-1(or 4)-monophosphatase
MNEYLEFAKELAREAGDIMLKYFTPDVQQHYKADKTLVTIADEEINQMVIKRVEEAYPEHTVLGEEASNDKLNEFAWVCDPIDGTNPFAKGLPVSTFSLALTKNGQPVVGVIMDPFTNGLYSPFQGGGAHLNDQMIKVSDKELGYHSVIHVDWWPSAEIDTWGAMHRLAKETSVYTLSIGSVVRASSLVASGKFDAAVFPGTKGKFMDIAAAKVIVEEAGGKVTDLFGNEQRYDRDIKGAVVSNGVCHQQILDALGKAL